MASIWVSAPDGAVSLALFSEGWSVVGEDRDDGDGDEQSDQRELRCFDRFRMSR